MIGPFQSFLISHHIDWTICRIWIYYRLQSLHQVGVIHGDFVDRNVVRRNSVHRPVIIDFSHAIQGHRCPGARCPELQEARTSLSLENRVFDFVLVPYFFHGLIIILVMIVIWLHLYVL